TCKGFAVALAGFARFAASYPDSFLGTGGLACRCGSDVIVHLDLCPRLDFVFTRLCGVTCKGFAVALAGFARFAASDPDSYYL
ncbi:MAG: hypothetical protein MJ175_01560, partial [Clostridia bacterium]|nr:hypothetical protein [Clostridia bacterium]